MAHVDFYILANGISITQFACHTAAKLWQDRLIHIHTESVATATKMNDLLWTFRDISFVPHEIIDGDKPADCPITIGIGESYQVAAKTLINLASHIPKFARDFERIIEIVSDDDDKKLARERYRQYKTSHHYNIQNHQDAQLNDIE